VVVFESAVDGVFPPRARPPAARGHTRAVSGRRFRLTAHRA
jgi:hypothetical protein